MRQLFFTVSLLAILGAGSSFASPPEMTDDIVKHLEFQGYDTSVTEDLIKATHAKNLNLMIRKYRGGMLATTYFLGSDYGKKNLAGWLPLVNKLNLSAAAARYYIDDEGDLAIEAYYPGQYNRKSFATFLEALEFERSNLSAISDELAKYLKN